MTCIVHCIFALALTCPPLTNDAPFTDGVCGYKGAAFKTDGGVVTATIPNASIA